MYKSFILSSILTVPLIATPKLPSANVRIAVIKAIRTGDTNILAAALTEHGLHVNSVLQKGGDTLLHYAAVEGSAGIVEYLIKHGAQVNVTNQYGYTPLDEATFAARIETVALLKQARATRDEGFQIKAVPTSVGDGIPADQLDADLRIAASKGETEMINLLLELGADIEAKNYDGNTALMYAAFWGKTEMVNLLLKRGANIEAKNDNGNTALMYAAYGGKTETVTRLLELGANIEAKDNDGNTALMYAADRGKIDTVVQLLEYNANIETKNDNGNTALIIAAKLGNKGVFKLLSKLDVKQ